MTALAFVDCETTGLDPERHEVWEVALMLRLPVVDGVQPTFEKGIGFCCEEQGDGWVQRLYQWFLPVDLGRADPVALTIGGFYQRYSAPPYPEVFDLGGFAGEFARLTHGAHLVGAVPSFDAAFLAPLLRRRGACPGWHYHLVDVEVLTVGALLQLPVSPRNVPDLWDRLTLPWDSELISRALLGDEAYEALATGKHTAVGDVRWAMALYDTVMAR